MPTLGAVKKPKARKEHVCSLCSTPIWVGTTYLTWTWLDRAWGLAHTKVHQSCDKVREELQIYEWFDGVLVEYIQDNEAYDLLACLQPDLRNLAFLEDDLTPEFEAIMQIVRGEP